MKLPARLIVAAHVSSIYGPVQALVNFLKRRSPDFIFVSLPFSYSGLSHAGEERFLKGKLMSMVRGHDSRGWDPWLWSRDFFFAFTRGWKAGSKDKVDLYIGVDCLNALAGIVLRAFGRVRRVVFYSIDYTPRRFKNPVLSGIYAMVDRIAATQSDAVWNLSERMRAVRRGQGVIESANLLVPVGVELKKIKRVAKADIRRRSLLYMGALHANKGIQLLIEAFPLVLKKVPKAELHIIGYGPFEDEVRRRVSASPAAKRIFMPGGMGHDELFRQVPKFGVALAPYLDDPDSYTWWCDPTKPKEYLACGLPLIITRVPWLWERVADKRTPMGIAIDYKIEDLVAAAVRLLGDDAFYRRCRRNAQEFSAGLEWDGIFERAFSGTCA